MSKKIIDGTVLNGKVYLEAESLIEFLRQTEMENRGWFGSGAGGQALLDLADKLEGKLHGVR